MSREQQTQGGRTSNGSANVASKEQIASKLREMGLLGITPQTDRFYNLFVEGVAGMGKNASELVAAWELATRETLSGCSPVFIALFNLDFDNVMDAVAADSNLAEQAKSLRRDHSQAVSVRH